MDVITVLRPENNFTVNAFTVPRAGVAATRSEGGRYQFALPTAHAILLGLAVALALVPPLQRSIGLYRLEKISLSPDGSLPVAFDSVLGPSPAGTELEASAAVLEAASAAIAETVPEALKPVAWQRYTVRQGDSVSRIASRFSLRNMSTVLAVNGIDNARRLRVGQVLEIPSIDGIVHVVSRGDTLSSIAKRYSVSMNGLLDANDLESEALVAGQRLFIPGASLSRFDLKKAMGELFIRPVAGRLTSSYGYRADPFTGARTFHTGIDLAVPLGTPVKATLDGRIAATGYSPVYGNYVIITHDGGYQSLYGHLQSISVKKGASVLQGGLIGKAGSTGYSTGPHVHFTVYKNGKMINPLSVLE